MELEKTSHYDDRNIFLHFCLNMCSTMRLLRWIKPLLIFLKFPKKSINYISQLFSDNGFIKKLHEWKRKYILHESSFSQWL